ncbi:MAG: cytochrome c [Bryobacteraceae bacterium]
MKAAAVFLLLALTTLSIKAADLKNGKSAYDTKCKSCHGADGKPNPAIAKMFKVEMRDLSSPDVQALSDDQIKKVITDGQGKMRPVKTVSGSTLDDVVAYVRSLKK